jgi:hypothetical protein
MDVAFNTDFDFIIQMQLIEIPLWYHGVLFSHEWILSKDSFPNADISKETPILGFIS